MAKGRRNGTALVLWVLFAVITSGALFLLSAADEGLAGSSPVGGATPWLLAVVPVIALAGAVTAWRGASRVPRAVIAVAVFAAAALVVILAVTFIGAGSTGVTAMPLLLLEAFSLIMIGSAVTQAVHRAGAIRPEGSTR
ncbi:hypothetical protein [Actinoplanes sp. RD1]|uniref:hypothetical protein n=1 Tax=Actinoplanes sp. RD1 TaxID=3064538 RepID=UPI0027414102|nr:hypothetical protein [Actinoplanes sp. RD1]